MLNRLRFSFQRHPLAIYAFYYGGLFADRLYLFLQRPPGMSYALYCGWLFAYFIAWGLVGLNCLVALFIAILFLFI